MDQNTSVMLAIFAMIAWGFSDFLAAVAMKKVSFRKLLLWTQGLNFAIFIVAFIILGKSIPAMSPTDIAIVAAGSFLTAVSYTAFYKGLETGSVSIVAPISYSWPVLAVPIGLLLFGEKMTALSVAGAVVAVVGSLMASVEKSEKGGSIAKGVSWAVLCTVAWASYSVMISYLAKRWQDGFVPVFLFRTIGVAIIFVAAPFLFPAGREKRDFPLALLVGVALFEFIAFSLYGVAAEGNISIVAPITAAAPAITIILARIFLKEKLQAHQKIGVFMAIAGVILLSI